MQPDYHDRRDNVINDIDDAFYDYYVPRRNNEPDDAALYNFFAAGWRAALKYVDSLYDDATHTWDAAPGPWRDADRPDSAAAEPERTSDDELNPPADYPGFDDIA